MFKGSMTLWLRRSVLVSPADADRADDLVIEHDKVIGRIYEQRYVPADARWFWPITVFHIDPALGIPTNGRVPTLCRRRRSFVKLGVTCVRPPSKKNSSGSKLREWQVVNPEREVAKQFGLSSWPMQSTLWRVPHSQGPFTPSRPQGGFLSAPSQNYPDHRDARACTTSLRIRRKRAAIEA
jgi:hypothetical protein